MDPFYITTPIYYVNDIPHIGHAYTTTVSDVMARFARLDGRSVKFLTGTDEHGQKVQKAAGEMDPHLFVDRVSQNFRDLGAVMNFSTDDFIRTTETRHIAAAQAIWEKIESQGDIYLGTYSGWYALRDECFYTEDELVDGKAPTGAPVEWVEELSYFFRLSAWQQPLLEWYESHPNFIGPASRRNEVISFVKGGLRDLSISRTSFSWGIPVPGDPRHIMYVWFDALTNYISALGYPETQHTDFQTFWPAAFHMVGKDILRFHAVYWPAFLMAAGLTPPQRIFAHGFWTNDGKKMSKSLGNGIDPRALVQTYGVDAVRFFFLREVPFGQDGDFSHAAMVSRLNSDLANDLGNLVQRTLTLTVKNCDGKIPSPHSFQAEDSDLMNRARSLVKRLRPLIEDTQEFHKYCEEIWEIIRCANRYIELQAPWSLAKTDSQRMETVLYTLLETLRCVGIVLQPVMPESAARMLDFLAVPLDARQFDQLEIPLDFGGVVPAYLPLFPRRDAHVG